MNSNNFMVFLTVLTKHLRKDTKAYNATSKPRKSAQCGGEDKNPLSDTSVRPGEEVLDSSAEPSVSVTSHAETQPPNKARGELRDRKP